MSPERRPHSSKKNKERPQIGGSATNLEQQQRTEQGLDPDYIPTARQRERRRGRNIDRSAGETRRKNLGTLKHMRDYLSDENKKG